ncbi:hypothetical protein [Rhizobium etli]|uniref:hypothetical protein n=1 Tax=Rhizobium etli TaxID=29449 RepID=UPI00038397BF|nr:hypothetical protein [Rhizobium etli]AGS25793.1 hypothetical protein REMIM1_PF00123 [Rhizobium etli bv. mimosae str. Mim1]
MDLTVYIRGSGQDDRLLTLPLDVYSSKGDLLASGAASPHRPANFIVSGGGPRSKRLYVVAKLPSGSTLQESVDTKDDSGSVEFELGSPHEWLQWVAPFQSLDHLRDDITVDPHWRRRIGRVWMTLWSLIGGRWQSQKIDVASRQSDPTGIQQVTLQIPNYPHLLQVGGDEVGWRLVALPPGQMVRVALTRSAGKDGDAVNITIAREQADNEIILSYLAGGAIGEANALAETLDIADRLLQEKIGDPVSAVAGGYFLLRNNKLETREDWVHNLKNWFPEMADGAILSAALAARSDGAREARIRKDIEIALNRGMPIFAMGAEILLRTMAAVHRGENEKKGFHQRYLALQAYVRASIPAGPYFAFEGLSPAEPTWVSVFGPQDQPGFGDEPDGTPRGLLVYSRPQTLRARYGQTAVKLPRAPVSTSVATAMEKAILTIPAALPSPDVPAVTIKRLTARENNRNLPIRETTFLSHLTAPETIPALRLDDGRRRRYSRGSPVSKSVADGIPTIGAGETQPKQTERYWRTQRERNAFTLFDE